MLRNPNLDELICDCKLFILFVEKDLGIFSVSIIY